MGCWVKGGMWQCSQNFGIQDNCWKEKAGVETKRAMERRSSRLRGKSVPNLESGVHEGRERQVNGFAEACKPAAPGLGSKVARGARGEWMRRPSRSSRRSRERKKEKVILELVAGTDRSVMEICPAACPRSRRGGYICLAGGVQRRWSSSQAMRLGRTAWGRQRA